MEIDKYYATLEDIVVAKAIEKYLECIPSEDVSKIYATDISTRKINDRLKQTVIQMATLFALCKYEDDSEFKEYCALLIAESRKDLLYMIEMRMFYLKNADEIAGGELDVLTKIIDFRTRYTKVATQKIKMTKIAYAQ